MKLLKIMNAVPSLQALSNTKFPAKTSARLSRLLRALQPEVDTFEAERRKLCQEFGTELESGEGFQIRPECVQEFNAQLQALLEDEVKVDIPLITEEDLGNVEIEPTHLVHLFGLYE